MLNTRDKALNEILSRKPLDVANPKDIISKYYGTHTFNMDIMKKNLTDDIFENIKKSIDTGDPIDMKTADSVANAMKTWAIEFGVTHYTHWFHPLNGQTAEKHDSFLNLGKNGKVFEAFSGKELVQQEPDASSFPNGGIRNTFEARGYTAWDPSSPAFIIDKTLCIPTIFVSYNGETLDYKTPLLKSSSVLDKASVDICKFFDKDVNKVISTLGWEQEYFLIDEALYYARPDLILTSRTLMGHSSAKDQQLSDNYFGSIPERVSAFMRELEYESYLLGIPIKTKHNEVAPNQFECAPIFEEVNLAVDHNQLLMDIMKKIARKHKFRVLLHEKPYKGVNGSGKHNNWSLQTNTGVNLLAPGKNSKKNLQFLTFFINTIKAVYDYSDLLTASIMSAGNEHRLGGHEAPPSIISIFIGDYLTKILKQIENNDLLDMEASGKKELNLKIGKIPQILLDNTDRNRTSPFAFTGNRFEFRAVGSSINCASPMIVLNTIVANQLIEFKKDVDELINSGINKNEAILNILNKYIIHSKDILFEGNGYSEEWKKEAEQRGLKNVNGAVDGFKAFIDEKNVELFKKLSIFNEREINALYDIQLDIFAKKIQIESRVLGDLAINHIVPTVIEYQNRLIENVKGLKDILPQSEVGDSINQQLNTINRISKHKTNIVEMVHQMINARKEANKIDDVRLLAEAYNDNVKHFMDEIRYHIDKLELIVDDKLWPLPKYRELLFTR